MELAKYKACICEGSAENAIIDILLDNDLLIFTREEMLEEEVIRCRDGKRFEEKYLRKGFMDKISVIRVLDSRRENFKLSKAYEHKVDVINVITAPEIEMLIIFNEDKYKEFKKSGKKPSDFCKEDLKMTGVKSYIFVKDLFGGPFIVPRKEGFSMAGRKPKPTALKKLEGNPGKRKLNTKEPVLGKGMPDCPKWLLPETKREWERLCVKLSEMGVLTEIDMAAFTAYCQSYALKSPYRRNAKFRMNDGTVSPKTKKYMDCK